MPRVGRPRKPGGFTVQRLRASDPWLRYFGAAIRERREAVEGRTQRAFADLVEMSQAAIGRIELGQCDPPITTALAIAKALDTELGELVAVANKLEKKARKG